MPHCLEIYSVETEMCGVCKKLTCVTMVAYSTFYVNPVVNFGIIPYVKDFSPYDAKIYYRVKSPLR